jgi:hypothetical protein
LRTYATNSLLQNGDWFKIKVDTSGIFKLTYQQLKDIGLSKPENARLYSYGGKQLSYANADFNYDDLNEIPIKQIKGDDGIFNENDYIIFYAEGPTTWEFNETLGLFLHKKHYYSEFTYLFISDFLGAKGLKIEVVDNKNLSTNYTTNSFDSYKCFETNVKNIAKTGRKWYSELFSPGESATYNFTFPSIIKSETTQVYIDIAGKKDENNQTCYFNVSSNNSSLGIIDVPERSIQYIAARGYSKLFNIPNPNPTINLKLSFFGDNSLMEGYLDFICINAREQLKMQGSQFMFRDIRSVDSAKVSKFNIDNVGKTITLWNITNPVKPYELKLTNQNNISSFNINSDVLHQFIAFEEANFFTPVLTGNDLGKVANQNLHATPTHDMIIITHPLFQTQAEELAEIRRNEDTLSVFVTQSQLIYNEFSSGTPDVSALRNFMRMLYDRADSINTPKYLLLFGDGSYDTWSTSNENSNLIPTFQSYESLSETLSYVSDDYFGLLDIDEGEIKTKNELRISGYLDVGIGRFPVKTVEEADLMIAKIKNYMAPSSYGSWKNTICFIGDDEDSGQHMNQPEEIDQEIVKILNPEYNVNKIYLDAYKQISTPSGQKYPDVNKAISAQMEQGALIVDYVGHGNPSILAHEQILGVPEARNWKNWDKLTLFVTASCEVGRYDDYKQTSLGEWFLLNPTGGGIAALTTTRVVYSGANHDLNSAFFKNALQPNNRLGDIVRIAKNTISPSIINHRNFSLLGDPSLKLSIPKNKIVVGSINNNYLPLYEPSLEMQANDINATVAYAPGDTIYALSKARVEGVIDDENGYPLNKDGVLYITIYDKTDTLYTYGQGGASPVEFILQNNILYKGKASITEGYFNFEFIVPKDINYKFGKGKISLYAVIDSTEAMGYSENIIIGGSAMDAEVDIKGPDIHLYMNDSTFRNGGTTNENPIFIAQLIDDNGINTTGIGFGHNITAVLDGNQDNIFMLNNYYEGDLDKYNSGKVRYPFSNLTPGYHYIAFKTWDIYNNSSEAMLEFYVKESGSTSIENMINSPNPFRDETWFTFEHNQAFDDAEYDAFDISIHIYDIMGNKVTQLNAKNSSAGFKITPIRWSGTSASGAKLPKGVYVYRTEITSIDGEKSYKSSKLMIF